MMREHDTTLDMEPKSGHDSQPAARHRIDPQTVTKPMQLLAAWLVALIVTVGMFLHDLAQTLRLTGLDLDGLIFGGRSLQDAPAEAQDQIVSLTSRLREQISHLDRTELRVDPDSPRDHPALIAGKALMAEGRWKQAAPYFEQYIDAGYEDWQVYFAIGYCRGKSHDGPLADRAALEAYDHAMRLAPENLSPLARAV